MPATTEWDFPSTAATVNSDTVWEYMDECIRGHGMITAALDIGENRPTSALAVLDSTLCAGCFSRLILVSL